MGQAQPQIIRPNKRPNNTSSPQNCQATAEKEPLSACWVTPKGHPAMVLRQYWQFNPGTQVLS